MLEYIITEVKNNNLTVKVKHGKNIKSSKNNIIKITIPFKDINKVSLAGSGDIKLKGNTNNLKANISGSGDIVYKGTPEKENTKVAGSGSISTF